MSDIKEKSDGMLGSSSYLRVTPRRLAISMIMAIIFLYAITYKNNQDFQRTLVQFILNPYTTIIAISLIGIYLRTKANEEWRFFGEAILTAALVGLLIELPHIRSVFSEGLTDMLVDPKYINSLTPSKRDILLSSLIKSKLNIDNEYNDVVDFYVKNLNKKLSSPQYVKSDKHTYIFSFANNGAGLMLHHTIERTVFLPTVGTDHKLRVSIDGQSEYQLNISDFSFSNFQTCYEYSSTKGTVKDGIKGDKYICKVSTHGDGKDHKVLDIEIISSHPKLEVHIQEESFAAANDSLEWEDLVNYFYDVNELTLLFTFPEQCALQIDGYGDFIEEFNDVETSNKRTHLFSTSNQKKYEASFAAGYSSGSGILTKLRCEKPVSQN